MADLIPFPLSRQKAQEMLRALPSERIFVVRHAEQRMAERDVSLPDVLDCLHKGRIEEGPGSMPDGAWRVTVSWFRAGRKLAIVTELKEDDQGVFAIIITTI